MGSHSVHGALFALSACAALACSDATSGSNATTSTNTTTSTSASTTSSTTTTTTTTGAGGGLPAYATFHLNYTQTKDFAKCAERDFVVFDGLDTPAGDIAQCRNMGAKLLCYFSSQYEDWRADAASFGALTGPLDGWPGEQWVDPADPANLAVMSARLDLLAQKGCDGVDNVDNVDHAGHETYVLAIYAAARARGLLVSQKNAIASIQLFWDAVDLYQNEQCQEYAECDAYANLGRPVHNIEYTPCHTIAGLYSQRKDVQAIDAWEELCPP